MPPQRHIFLIDDDASVLRSLGRVMTQAGFTWDAYESADDFLASADLAKSGCILADLTLIGMTGLDLKERLNSMLHPMPVIFLTAEDTAEVRAAARDAGAVGFFRKPVDTQALLDAIEWALQDPSDRRSPLAMETAVDTASSQFKKT